MQAFLRLFALVSLLAVFATPPARCDEPLWEAGVGIAGATFPSYRGSRQQRGFVVPIPYFVYRGDRLRVGREGARGLLASTPDFEVDVSADAAIPVANTNNGPRAGMSELDPVVELGPSVVWRLGETDAGRWSLHLPLRAAIATDLRSARQEGWVLEPALALDALDLAGGWDFRFRAGLRFGSRQYHAYYYDVGTRDVRPDRPLYHSAGGFGGTALQMGASRRFGDLWVGFFLRYDNLDGAVFDDSPLVETRQALSAGVGVSWVLWKSDTRVPDRR